MLHYEDAASRMLPPVRKGGRYCGLGTFSGGTRGILGRRPWPAFATPRSVAATNRRAVDTARRDVGGRFVRVTARRAVRRSDPERVLASHVPVPPRRGRRPHHLEPGLGAVRADLAARQHCRGTARGPGRPHRGSDHLPDRSTRLVPGSPLGGPAGGRGRDDVHGTRTVPGPAVQLAAQGRPHGHARRRRGRRAPRSVDHPRDGQVTDEPPVPGRGRRRRCPHARPLVARRPGGRVRRQPRPGRRALPGARGPRRRSRRRPDAAADGDGGRRAGQGARQGVPAGPRAPDRRRRRCATSANCRSTTCSGASRS